MRLTTDHLKRQPTLTSNKENHKRAFLGIWVPRELWEEKRLSLREKFLLLEINSLDQDGNGCWASNKYLAENIQISPTTIPTMLVDLRKRGFITGPAGNGYAIRRLFVPMLQGKLPPTPAGKK